MKITHTEDVDKLRKASYPPLEDLADAIYWESQGDRSKLDAYNAKVATVKARLPKLAAIPPAPPG